MMMMMMMIMVMMMMMMMMMMMVMMMMMIMMMMIVMMTMAVVNIKKMFMVVTKTIHLVTKHNKDDIDESYMTLNHMFHGLLFCIQQFIG